MKTNLIKGFRDFTGEEAEKRAEIKKILINIFERYGFEPAETPIIEYQEFVKGSNQQDEVISDIFRLRDKGKRNLALRYEFTFQLKRLIKNKKLPYKRYQIGEVFRDEPVSANRFRQFIQCDVDIVGSTIKDEAEILSIASEILKEIGIEGSIYVGNRKLINEIIEKEEIKGDKEQILREIDKLECKCKFPKKEVINNLKKFKAEKLISIFEKPESYFKKYKAYEEIEELKEACGYYNLKLNFQPSLVRGLSYYTGNVFEIRSKNMRESICGGGSYKIDGTQATGISFGLERLSSLANIKCSKKKYLIWPNGKDKEAINISKKLRNQEIICDLIYKTNMKKVFDYANSKKFNKVIFYDKKSNKFKVKDMKTGKEKLIK
ncbi:Histidine--tRNA ligase [subsurface metagenome]